MANSTLLALVNAAQGELGLAVSSTVVANTADEVTQLRYLINALGNGLKREYPWQATSVEYRFSSVAYTYTATTADTSTTISVMS